MPMTLFAIRQTLIMRAATRILEFGVAVSAPLLCSYWILEGRW